MDETLRLAEFIADTGYGDLPAEVVEATRVFILDDLASGMVGSATPWVGMVRELAQENGGDGPCSMFGCHWTTSPAYAALVNGTAIGGFETDQAFFRGSSHPGAAVFPGVLAVAERGRLNGRSFLTAVALGYEVCCRVGEAATRAVEDISGFHGPGTNGPIGSAAGVGKALGLNGGMIVNALGIASSHASGLMEFAVEGAMTKRLHLGRAAQTGLESARLAAKGFTGPSTALEGDRGFLKVYSPSPEPHQLTEALGHRYLMLEVSCKSYACHMSFHPVIEGAVKFKEKHSLRPDVIGEVRVDTTPRIVRRHGQREPSTILGAQYSLPFSLAIALTRDVSDPLTFSETTLWSSDVRELSRRVELLEDGERFGGPGGPVAEVTLVLAGETHKFLATDWKGAPSNPYTFEEMCVKFQRYAKPFLETEQIQEICHRVRRIEEEGDVGELGRLLRTRQP